MTCHRALQKGWTKELEGFGSPIAFASALLLVHGWVGAGEAGLTEVAREVFLRSSRAIGEANMVTVSSLVRASHCGRLSTFLFCTGSLHLSRYGTNHWTSTGQCQGRTGMIVRTCWLMSYKMASTMRCALLYVVVV
jgi:hypothetical protein